MANALIIRPAVPADGAALRQSIVALPKYERGLHDTRLPGALIADRYRDWLQHRSDHDGMILVAGRDGAFAGFVAGWNEQDAKLAETAESNRHGLVSDICVMPASRRTRSSTRN